jgi:hypothetical protein
MTLCQHGVQTGTGYECSACVTTPGSDEPSPVIYLIWSQKHNAWWRPDGWGYTDSIDDAGRFAEGEAVKAVVASAQCGIREQVSCMVAAPDNWGER